MTSDYIIIVMVELVSKTVTGHIHIIYYGNDDFRLHNHCRGSTHIEKQLQDIPISCVMVMMTLDYIIVVTVELASKNGYRTYPYHVLW